MIKTNLSLNWTGPKILAVGPAQASDTPDNRPLHDKLLFLDQPSDLPERDCKCRVSIERCKRCQNPDDSSDTPKYLPSDLTQYVLNSFSTKCLPFHVTLDDVSPPPDRLEVEQITGHQLVRGRGGTIAGPIRDPLGRTARPLLGAGTRPSTLRTTHPPLLVSRPNTTPTGEPPLPTNAHCRRTAGAITIER